MMMIVGDDGDDGDEGDDGDDDDDDFFREDARSLLFVSRSDCLEVPKAMGFRF